jgi:replicative DNA helicase Mcm
VVRIRPAGRADVFDIEVPDGHRFIANGIVSHNTAKSQLLRYISNLVPRGIYASGKASTAAGLTAAAVHDEFGEGRWTLEAGALVLADKGLACIDELDKMSEQDSSSMHEAMEQQMISVAKAGITATLQSRCAILAAANPKEGRFDEHSYLVDQIDLAPTLLSRFDVIFALTDKPDQTRDAALAGHITSTHLAGEIAQYRKNVQDRKYSAEDELDAMARVEPKFPPAFLRKYIAYSRSRVFPVMTRDTMDIIQDYYVNIRAQSRTAEGEGGAVPMTPRQVEALIRLSEASARVRLSNKVTTEDAERAKKIVEYFLRKVASEGGRLDIDAIMTGTTHSQRERIHSILDIVEELDEGRGVTEEEILRRMTQDGVPEDKVRHDIERLHNEGRLFQPTGGRYKVARERR